eukprot:g3610.t1
MSFKPSAPPLPYEAQVVMDMEDEMEKMKEVIRKEIGDLVESGKRELSTRKLRERVERLVRREVERRVRSDPEIREMIRDYKEELRIEVARVARRALEEIVNEDRYHLVNRAFLDSIRRRADETIAKTQSKLSSKINISYITSILAMVLSIYSTYRMSRL